MLIWIPWNLSWVKSIESSKLSPRACDNKCHYVRNKKIQAEARDRSNIQANAYLKMRPRCSEIRQLIIFTISRLIMTRDLLTLLAFYRISTVFAFSLHHLFRYINIFLSGVDVTLVIWFLVVFIVFGVLYLVLQICHSPLIYPLSNYLGPFVLLFIIVWDGCILASNRCIVVSFSPIDALMFHFYLLTRCQQGFSCGWSLRNIILMTILFLPGKRPSSLVLLVMILTEVNSRLVTLSSETLFARIGYDE